MFGDKASPAGQKYSDLTMYDFRHIACCYWLPRYKSESALKYRFGWKKLSPKNLIDIEGNIAYAEGFQAWNIIRLKKEIVDEFPQLKEKRSKFSYRLNFYRDYNNLLKTVKKLKEENVMPMLMFLYKED